MFFPFSASEPGWLWMSDSGGSLGGAPAGDDDGSTHPSAEGTGDAGVDNSSSGPEGGGEVAGQRESPPPSPTQAPPPSDWRDKRIAALTRKLREMQDRGQAPAQPPQAQPPQPPSQPFSQQDIDRLAEQRARELAIVHDFNRRCDEVAMMGRSSFGEAIFNERITNLQKLVDSTDPSSVQAYNSFLTAAMDTGDAAKLLHSLGGDLDEAQRILNLPATRMAVELTRRAMTPEAQVSNAPRPIQTVGGRGVTHEAISPDDPDRADHLGVSEWMRRREQQIADRNRARARNGFLG